MHTIHIRNVTIGPKAPLAIIAGPCVAESRSQCLGMAEKLQRRCSSLGLGYVFKASFDKANRSSIRSHRGPGRDEALRWLDEVRSKLGVPVTTDIHETAQAKPASEAVDLLQIPAFLCRQTDLLLAAAGTGKPVNVKKGQFLSPGEMSSVVEKLTEGGARDILLTERGSFFGYGRLVNDFIGVGDLMDLGHPVCFDVTHSTQLPGASASRDARITGGRPDRAPLLARAAVAAGVQALFIETHPDPAKGLSDTATMLPLKLTLKLLEDLARLRAAMK